LERHTWLETYLRDGEFDPDAMPALVEEVLQRYPLVRIVGYMNFPEERRKAPARVLRIRREP
jgi:hypothetical protein